MWASGLHTDRMSVDKVLCFSRDWTRIREIKSMAEVSVRITLKHWRISTKARRKRGGFCVLQPRSPHEGFDALLFWICCCTPQSNWTQRDYIGFYTTSPYSACYSITKMRRVTYAFKRAVIPWERSDVCHTHTLRSWLKDAPKKWAKCQTTFLH